MKPFIIGIGRAGCKIASIFFEKSNAKMPYNGVLLDTDRNVLSSFSHNYKILLGEGVVDGNGTNNDLELGREIIDSERIRIVEMMDSLRAAKDCFFVISALGGGTGGAVDVLIDELKKSYMEKVYYLGILPSQEDPKKLTINFSNSFKKILSSSHAIFPIDNDLMKAKLRLVGQLNMINLKIFEHFNHLFEIGEVMDREELGGSFLSTSVIINTLEGISSLGFSSIPVGSRRDFGLFNKGGNDSTKPELVLKLTQECLDNFLLPFDLEGSKKGLIQVAGPMRYMDFAGSVPARLFLEEHIENIEFRGGDRPSLRKNELEVLLLISGIRKSDRLKYLFQTGKILQRGANNDNYDRILSERLKVLKKKLNETGKVVDLISRDLKG